MAYRIMSDYKIEEDDFSYEESTIECGENSIRVNNKLSENGISKFQCFSDLNYYTYVRLFYNNLIAFLGDHFESETFRNEYDEEMYVNYTEYSIMDKFGTEYEITSYDGNLALYIKGDFDNIRKFSDCVFAAQLFESTVN